MRSPIDPVPPSHPSHPCRRASQDEGEAVKIKAVKEAEAEAARTEIQAKADAEAKFLAGQGIARQRQAIMEGLRESVNAFKSEVQDVDAKTVMDLMIVTQCASAARDPPTSGRQPVAIPRPLGSSSLCLPAGLHWLALTRRSPDRDAPPQSFLTQTTSLT